MKNWKTCGTAAVFLGLLALGTGASLLWPQRRFSETENRYLTGRPELSLEGVMDGSYGETYEKYLGDQFPLRDGFVGIKTAAERFLGRQDVNGVYFGKDGYLLERFEREDIETEQLEENLDALAAFLLTEGERLGTDRVKAMLVPSAAWAMPEKLPLLAAPYDQQEVLRKLSARLGGAEVLVDAGAALRESGKDGLYYRTDHHWTVSGAYEGYRAWAEAMGIVPWERSAFSVETVSRDFVGTVQAKVNWKTEPDAMERWTPRDGTAYEVFYDGSEEKAAGGLYTESALESRDKYRFYLDGNHGLTEIRTVRGTGETESDSHSSPGAGGQPRRLCIIKDSYANSFAPFAANHYETTFLLDLRYFNGNISHFLEQEGITDLLVLYRIPGFAAEETLWKLPVAKQGGL